jgi:hypothetical protein
LRATDFVVVKGEDGYARMADGLQDFFKRSKTTKETKR